MAGELSVEKYVHKLLTTVDFLWKSGVSKISDMPLTQLQAPTSASKYEGKVEAEVEAETCAYIINQNKLVLN